MERTIADNEKHKQDDRKNGVLIVNPKPDKGIVSSAIDLLEKVVVSFMHDSSKPLHYLSGNFSPAKEETPPYSDLVIDGSLPDYLNGEFVRVGPNPKFMHVAGYYVAMLGAQGSYCYVKRPVACDEFLCS